MSRNRSRELLASLPLFHACSDKELKHIESLVTEVEVPAGRELMTQGQIGNETYVIASGEADVVIDGRTVASAGAGQMLGEMSLLDRTAVRSATVVSRTPMTLLVLDPRGFSDLVDQHPSVTRQIAVGLAARLRAYEASPVA